MIGMIIIRFGVIAIQIIVVVVKGQEKPGQQTMTGGKIGHASRLRKFGMDACRGRVGFQELLAAHHAGTTGDEAQFVKQQCTTAAAAAPVARSE
jgi:hypothetical protein